VYLEDGVCWGKMCFLYAQAKRSTINVLDEFLWNCFLRYRCHKPLTSSGYYTYHLLQQKRFISRGTACWNKTPCILVYGYHFILRAPQVRVLPIRVFLNPGSTSWIHSTHDSMKFLSSGFPSSKFCWNSCQKNYCFYNKIYTHLTVDCTVYVYCFLYIS
jgi:hypothetical protein